MSVTFLLKDFSSYDSTVCFSKWTKILLCMPVLPHPSCRNAWKWQQHNNSLQGFKILVLTSGRRFDSVNQGSGAKGNALGYKANTLALVPNWRGKPRKYSRGRWGRRENESGWGGGWTVREENHYWTTQTWQKHNKSGGWVTVSPPGWWIDEMTAWSMRCAQSAEWSTGRP